MASDYNYLLMRTIIAYKETHTDYFESEKIGQMSLEYKTATITHLINYQNHIINLN